MFAVAFSTAMCTTRRNSVAAASLRILRMTTTTSTCTQADEEGADATATTHTTASTSKSLFTATDRIYLQQAVDCARRGWTHTFPNPAVGCVIVQETQEHSTDGTADPTVRIQIAQGFHPRAGWPHAEIFALLQAAQYVPCGVAAAQAVVENDTATIQDLQLHELTERYRVEGAAALFRDCCSCCSSSDSDSDTSTTTTAYVTLEPCCHTGRTPPCAAALVEAKVDRVVIGVRDPNPIVDGGGMAVLQQQQQDGSSSSDDTTRIQVVVAPTGDTVRQACDDLLRNFRKRITMPTTVRATNSSYSGKQKRQLRATFGRRQQTKSAVSVDWGKDGARLPSYTSHVDDTNSDGDDDDSTLEQAVQELVIAPEWMEHLDDVLWQHELVQVQLNRAVDKKKQAQALGNRIASALGAQVVQSKGHGVLLYRPGMPPVLSLTHS